MTAPVSEIAIDIPVDARFTAKGVPLAVRYDGQVWAVATEPVPCFTKDSWWETQQSAPVGVGTVMDIEHWRVQVRLGVLDTGVTDVRAAPRALIGAVAARFQLRRLSYLSGPQEG